MESFSGGSGSRLLDTLKDHFLSEDLKTKRTDEKLKEVSSRLNMSRMKYLREKCLNHFLQQQSMENALLRQFLSLKVLSDKKETLGIEERYIDCQKTAYNSSTWKKATRPHVLETLRMSVREECSKLLQWVDSSSTHNSELVSLDHERIRKVPLIVQEKIAAVRLKQEEIRKLQREVSKKNVHLNKLINDNCTQLLSIISEYQLQFLAHDTRVNLDHLSCKTNALRLKLNVVRLQLMADTYSPDKVKALEEIRRHLMEYRQQLETRLVETEQSLLHYESLGPSFMKLANEYHELLEEIENKKWALEELHKTMK